MSTLQALRRRLSRSFIACFSATIFLCLGNRASAEDDPIRMLLFGSLDAGTSIFATSGFKAAPQSIDREGFAILGIIGAGARMERGPSLALGGSPVQMRTTGLASLVGGYQFFFDWGVLGLFAGPEGSLETVIGRAGFGTVENRFGVRLHSELWARTSEATLTTVTLVTGSARWDAYARISVGYRIFDTYLGPEVSAYADRTGYGKASLGLHATDFGFGEFRFRLSGGVACESETGRLGPYVTLAGWVPL